MQMDLQNKTSIWWIYYQGQVSFSSKGVFIISWGEYNETFTPIARMDSIRLVLAIASVKKWKVHHMDMKNTFLHGDLEEEIYMK